MIYNKVSHDAFSYIGTTQGKPEPSEKHKKGEIFYDITARKMYRHNGNEWEDITFEPEPTPIVPYKERPTITNCPNCGAPYEGKDRCEYCGTYLG